MPAGTFISTILFGLVTYFLVIIRVVKRSHLGPAPLVECMLYGKPDPSYHDQAYHSGFCVRMRDHVQTAILAICLDWNAGLQKGKGNVCQPCRV
jgi:hypothetical protein